MVNFSFRAAFYRRAFHTGIAKKLHNRLSSFLLSLINCGVGKISLYSVHNSLSGRLKVKNLKVSQFFNSTGKMAPVTKHFQYLVLGGGSGGIASARRAAEFGVSVGLIEKQALGGTCVRLLISQCGKFVIFLSLRFCVKSILVTF